MDPETRDVISRLEGSISNLDSKVDKLVEAMNRLTRIEERHAALTHTIERHENTLAEHDKRIRTVEGDSLLAGSGISINSKLVWALIGALVVAAGMAAEALL